MTTPVRMSRHELRASISLASIYALRMLGLFLVLPVFAVHAQGLPDADPTLIGLALGVYGLTQGLLQIPLGMTSDRIGRKPVIVAGLLVMAVGSFIAAAAPSLHWVVVGRAVQGAGAISAAVSAFIADTTHDANRTKAMAMVGVSIGLTFALSLIAAPMLYAAIGMPGIFALTGVLALIAVGVVLWVVPPAPPQRASEVQAPSRWRQVVLHPQLLRLNFGVFVLHASMIALFIVVPVLLMENGLPLAQHPWIYLPTMLISFALMMPPLRAAERRGQIHLLMRIAIGLLIVSAIGFATTHVYTQHTVIVLAIGLLIFFVAFNMLEAMLPSLTSRHAPADARGMAMGAYNTFHSIAFYVGGSVGGWLVARHGTVSVFVCVGVAALAWLAVTWGMQSPPNRLHPTVQAPTSTQRTSA